MGGPASTLRGSNWGIHAVGDEMDIATAYHGAKGVYRQKRDYANEAHPPSKVALSN